MKKTLKSFLISSTSIILSLFQFRVTRITLMINEQLQTVRVINQTVKLSIIIIGEDEWIKVFKVEFNQVVLISTFISLRCKKFLTGLKVLTSHLLELFQWFNQEQYLMLESSYCLTHTLRSLIVIILSNYWEINLYFTRDNPADRSKKKRRSSMWLGIFWLLTNYKLMFASFLITKMFWSLDTNEGTLRSFFRFNIFVQISFEMWWIFWRLWKYLTQDIKQTLNLSQEHWGIP